MKASASSPLPMSSRWIFLPSAPTSRASNTPPSWVASVATIDQYSCGEKRLDLALAVADEAQRHRLHAAAERAPGQLAPQHRREREADEIVEGAARQVGVDQRLVDLARLAHRRLHRVLGDGVEGDALDRHALQRPLLLQRLERRARRSPRPRGPGRWRGSSFSAPLTALAISETPLGAAALHLPDHA